MTNPPTVDPDFRQPIWTDPVDDGLDWIRANYRFLLGCIASGPPPGPAPIWPGWQVAVDISTLGNFATPDKWVYTKGSMRWEIRFVWASGVLSTVQVCYDNGVDDNGLLCFDPVAVKLGYTTTAKHFGDGSSPLNYYAVPDSPSPLVFHGLIDSSSEADYWTKMTLVMSLYFVSIPGDRMEIFVTGSLDTAMEIDADGSLHIRFEDRDGNQQSIYLEPTDSPIFALATGEWQNMILGINNDETASPETQFWKLWINGTIWYSGVPENDRFPTTPSTRAQLKPHSNGQPGGASKFGQKFGGPTPPEFYAAHIWGERTYLDPETNWDKFFELEGGVYKPIDLGAQGENPTGLQPDVFAPDGNLSNHVGSAPNWMEIGSVPNAPISPTD